MAKIIGKNTGGDSPGQFKDYAGGAVQTGYLLCNGASYATATYPALFGKIGYTFGGSGANFNVPDSRRRTHVGSGGTSTGTLGNTTGAVGGEENHLLTTPQIPAHNHGVNEGGGHHHNSYTTRRGSDQSGFTYDYAVNIVGAGGSVQQLGASGNVGTSTTGITIANAGGGQSHNNIQPSLVVTKMIKY